jgi:hypothetical protein
VRSAATVYEREIEYQMVPKFPKKTPGLTVSAPPERIVEG